eukprot:jgi/Bigna1/78860/fgenesh1_pg.57_\
MGTEAPNAITRLVDERGGMEARMLLERLVAETNRRRKPASSSSSERLGLQRQHNCRCRIRDNANIGFKEAQEYFLFLWKHVSGAVSEWLRRLPRKQLGIARASSNLVGVADCARPMASKMRPAKRQVFRSGEGGESKESFFIGTCILCHSRDFAFLCKEVPGDTEFGRKQKKQRLLASGQPSSINVGDGHRKDLRKPPALSLPSFESPPSIENNPTVDYSDASSSSTPRPMQLRRVSLVPATCDIPELYSLPTDKRTVTKVGRERAKCDLWLASTRHNGLISRTHARLTPLGNEDKAGCAEKRRYNCLRGFLQS